VLKADDLVDSTAEHLAKLDVSDDDDNEDGGSGKQQKKKKSRRAQKQPIAVPSPAAAPTPTTQPAESLVCAVCKQAFSARNKLFDHIKASGHAAPPADVAKAPSAGKSNKKGKGRRRNNDDDDDW